MEDVSVPINAIPGLIQSTYQIARKNNIEVLNFGHVGDGNVHVTFLKPESMNDENWKLSTEKSLEELYQITAQLEGSMTGEHGVGLKRKKYLPIFFRQEEIDLMKKIKKAIDPGNILNPSKLFMS